MEGRQPRTTFSSLKQKESGAVRQQIRENNAEMIPPRQKKRWKKRSSSKNRDSRLGNRKHFPKESECLGAGDKQCHWKEGRRALNWISPLSHLAYEMKILRVQLKTLSTFFSSEPGWLWWHIIFRHPVNGIQRKVWKPRGVLEDDSLWILLSRWKREGAFYWDTARKKKRSKKNNKGIRLELGTNGYRWKLRCQRYLFLECRCVASLRVDHPNFQQSK